LALTAYLVSNQDSPSLTDEINTWLKQKLPPYLIPSAYVRLEALPLTPSGKIDRRALPAPEPGTGRSSATPVPPSTPEEQLLAEIWEQVLGHPVVSVHDNFFELGGHSLKMMQVINRISKVFHLDLPLRSLFDAPTLAGLAALINERLVAEISELNEADAERLAQVD
jgi:acyl carrier protein